MKDVCNETAGQTGVSLDEIVEFYWRFLSRNTEYAAHFAQFKRRLTSDQKAAEAEAVVFSLLRAEKLNPDIYEDPSTGGPDFCCTPSSGESFLLEVTSLDSASVSKKSSLPLKITGRGGGAFSLITDKLRQEATNKARQLGGHSLPGVLAITSDYDFAGTLLGRGAAKDLMISAPQTNVPLNGDPPYETTDLHDAVFCRRSLLNASGELMISPCRQSIAAIFLITIYPREVNVVGLLHPEAARPFNPRWFPKVPYLRFTRWPLTGGSIAATEWILGGTEHREATFKHRRIR
ncbi:MAG: hypothetical protein WAN65_23935 [Candidatus Sulfotelmatobacter sp.]